MSRLFDPSFVVSYWPLNNHIEDVISGDDMSEVGTLLHTPGPFGRNARGPFSTSNYLLHTPSAGDWRSDSVGSISVWAKAFTIDQYNIIWCSSDTAGATNYFYVAISSSNFATIVSREGGATVVAQGDTVLEAGRWYHLVFTSDGAVNTCYVDGEPQTMEANSGEWLATVSNRDNISIGLRVNNIPDTPFDGALAEIRYYNIQVAALEAKELFRRQPPRG